MTHAPPTTTPAVPPPVFAPTATARTPAWSPADAALVDPIRDTVAELRELRWQRPVRVLVGESSAFDALLHARGLHPHRLMVGVFVDDTIWLRKTAARVEVIETIAHELVHALERQNGLLVSDLDTSAEAGLARSTLHEGVAIAVGRATVTRHSGGHAPRRTIAELGSTLEELSLSALTETDEGGTFQDRFPYAVGGGFAGALYVTGGTALWNAAERAPPTLLVHTLRPNLYLGGYTEPSAPLAEPVRPGAVPTEHAPRAAWIAQSILSEAAPERMAGWMDDFRGLARLQSGAEQTLVFAFGAPSVAAEVARTLREFPMTRIGPNHVLAGPASARAWRTVLPARGTPPLPRWPRAGAVLHPLEHDPVVAFREVGGRAVSAALGLAWSGVQRATRKGLSRSELVFGPERHGSPGRPRSPIVTTLLVRLPVDEPVENGLSLLVQSFVTNEVAALRVHPQPPVLTPAGTVHVRRIDTPEEPVTVALLPRCNARYALAFVVFDGELSYEGFRKRLGSLSQEKPDVETSTCVRAVVESTTEFTPATAQ